MKRKNCSICTRPINLCLCHCTPRYLNKSKIVILQHPSEAKKSFNTVRIAQNIFQNLEVHIGENFKQNHQLQNFIEQEQPYLLFPSETATDIKSIDTNSENHPAIIVLDGTWKKAKKILYLNEELQTLPMIKIKEQSISEFKLRKQLRPGHICTLEAITLALETLDSQIYSDALNPLQRLIEQQKHFDPKLNC